MPCLLSESQSCHSQYCYVLREQRNQSPIISRAKWGAPHKTGFVRNQNRVVEKPKYPFQVLGGAPGTLRTLKVLPADFFKVYKPLGAVNQGGWEGNSRPSTETDWPPWVLSNQSAESRWATLVLKNGRVRKLLCPGWLRSHALKPEKWLVLSATPVTQCRHKLSSNAVIPVHR